MHRMGDPLKTALAESQRVLEAALADARSELVALDRRRAELVEMIDQAEAMRRSFQEPTGRSAKPLTLHEAMCQILAEHDNRWMTVREIAEEANGRRLYRKKDGSDIEPNQIHARAKNYDQLFEKNGPEVRIRPEIAERREAS